MPPFFCVKKLNVICCIFTFSQELCHITPDITCCWIVLLRVKLSKMNPPVFLDHWWKCLSAVWIKRKAGQAVHVYPMNDKGSERSPGLGGGATVLLRLTWVKGQSGLVQRASYLQLGCTYRHLSPNLQLGKVLRKNKTHIKRIRNRD